MLIALKGIQLKGRKLWLDRMWEMEQLQKRI